MGLDHTREYTNGLLSRVGNLPPVVVQCANEKYPAASSTITTEHLLYLLIENYLNEIQGWFCLLFATKSSLISAVQSHILHSILSTTTTFTKIGYVLRFLYSTRVYSSLILPSIAKKRPFTGAFGKIVYLSIKSVPPGEWQPKTVIPRALFKVDSEKFSINYVGLLMLSHSSTYCPNTIWR